MGMDNTFYKIKKIEIQNTTIVDNKKIISEEEIAEILDDTNSYNKYELISFRKNYDLNEAIREDLNLNFSDYAVINKQQLEKVIELLNKKIKQFYNKNDENIYDDIQRVYLEGTIKTLETILKLFDFEKHYLVYQVWW